MPFVLSGPGGGFSIHLETTSVFSEGWKQRSCAAASARGTPVAAAAEGARRDTRSCHPSAAHQRHAAPLRKRGMTSVFTRRAGMGYAGLCGARSAVPEAAGRCAPGAPQRAPSPARLGAARFGSARLGTAQPPRRRPSGAVSGGPGPAVGGGERRGGLLHSEAELVPENCEWLHFPGMRVISSGQSQGVEI